MTSQVIVTADESGNVINVSKNPDYGYIRVQQIKREINSSGWLRFSTRSCLIHGLMKDLTSSNFKEGDVLPGKIVVKESLTPFDSKNPDRDLKIAGDSGVVCRFSDQPIYRQTMYTEDLMEQDVFIQHTNSEEIKEVLAAQKALSSLSGLRRTSQVSTEL